MFAAQVANLELTKDDGRERAGNRLEPPTSISGGVLSGSSTPPRTSSAVLPMARRPWLLAWRALPPAGPAAIGPVAPAPSWTDIDMDEVTVAADATRKSLARKGAELVRGNCRDAKIESLPVHMAAVLGDAVAAFAHV